MYRAFAALLSFFVHLLIAMAILAIYLYTHLPDISNLKKISYKQPLTVYTASGDYIATYGEVHRIPVKIENVPPKMIQALLSTEDQRFYKHHGIDFFGLIRAIKSLAMTGRKSQGASTITMQVARNFFLGREKTYLRKANEIMLALAIEKGLSKQEILELYLNKIYLGQRAYGVVAAAKIYFGKSLNELSIAEMAMIAGLPKAPSEYNPQKSLKAAKKRRNFVLDQMLKHHYINIQEYQQAIDEPLKVQTHSLVSNQEISYASELARLAMVEKFGANAYQEGYKVYITIDKVKQASAQQAVAQGIEQYDEKYGWRQPEVNLKDTLGYDIEQWKQHIANISSTPTGAIPAVVIALQPDYIIAETFKQGRVRIDISDSCWLVGCNKEEAQTIQTSDLALRTGDLIYTRKNKANSSWELRQIPQLQGALVSINPQTCKIDAIVGGYQFQRSHFNRAIQANRQPGSAVKPLLYAIALENGFNMASLINDAPVIEEDITGLDAKWRPKNVDRQFKGPVRLRQALIQSRNLVSVRLVKEIGISKAINYLEQMGLKKSKQAQGLSLSLGSGLVTPLELARAYSIFPRGGALCSLRWLERIENYEGVTISDEALLREMEQNIIPQQKDFAEKPVISKQNAYIISNALQDVVRYGTARGAKVLGRNDLCGKTGTTNDYLDAWFSGFNQDVVTTVWVGYDNAKSVNVPAAKLALPIWVDYMRTTLQAEEKPPVRPENVLSMRIDRKTGRLADVDDTDTMFELFAKGHEPKLLESHELQDENESPENLFV